MVQQPHGFNPAFAFDNFRRGRGNEDAYAAALLAAHLRVPYNTLVIVGKDDAGKTHLLHAVGNDFASRAPDYVVRYISGHEFTRAYREALSTSGMEIFRRTWHNGINVLLLDDLDTIDLGDGALQDELYDTLTSLRAGACTIVIASRLHPDALGGFNFRLTSFLRMGLITRIEKLPAQAPSIAAVLDVVASHFALKVSDLKGDRRHQNVSRARQIAMYLARKLCKDGHGQQVSFPAIAKAFGGKDHSTVLTACRKIEWLVAQDAAVRRTVEQIEQLLMGKPAHLA